MRCYFCGGSRIASIHDGEIMVGPCFSRDESAREFHHWKVLNEINRYNAMMERLA